MSIYIKLIQPWHRVPLLSDESIAQYGQINVEPHKGTTYGEIERVHLAELKLARKLGCELIRMDQLESVEVNI